MVETPSRRYASRIRVLVDDWCRIADTPAAAPAFGELVESAAGGHRLAAARLCTDGTPIEVCERLGSQPSGPSITCEGVSPDAMTGTIGAAVGHARPAGAIFFEKMPTRANATIWIGAESDARGRVHGKIYLSLDGRVARDAARRCTRALAVVAPGSMSHVARAAHFLEARGYLRMLALSFGRDAFIGAKLYARFRNIDLADLGAL